MLMNDEPRNRHVKLVVSVNQYNISSAYSQSLTGRKKNNNSFGKKRR